MNLREFFNTFKFASMNTTMNYDYQAYYIFDTVIKNLEQENFVNNTKKVSYDQNVYSLFGEIVFYSNSSSIYFDPKMAGRRFGELIARYIYWSNKTAEANFANGFLRNISLSNETFNQSVYPSNFNVKRIIKSLISLDYLINDLPYASLQNTSVSFNR